MAIEFETQFDDPRTVAQYVGEAVGTHYSAALRAANTYAKHLAKGRNAGDPDALREEDLRDFWLEMMRLEEVRQSTPDVIKGLRSDASLYFSDFLKTAEETFVKRYENVPEAQRKKLGHTQHQQCIRLLKDHKAAGFSTHFEVANQVEKWIQMLRVMGGYKL